MINSAVPHAPWHGNVTLTLSISQSSSLFHLMQVTPTTETVKGSKIRKFHRCTCAWLSPPPQTWLPCKQVTAKPQPHGAWSANVVTRVYFMELACNVSHYPARQHNKHTPTDLFTATTDQIHPNIATLWCYKLPFEPGENANPPQSSFQFMLIVLR